MVRRWSPRFFSGAVIAVVSGAVTFFSKFPKSPLAVRGWMLPRNGALEFPLWSKGSPIVK